MFRREIEIQQIGKGAMLYAVLPAKRTSALHWLHSSERQVDQYFLSE